MGRARERFRAAARRGGRSAAAGRGVRLPLASELDLPLTVERLSRPVNTLPDFVRSHKQQILTEWLGEVRQLPSAHCLPVELLRDHIPDFIDCLADAIERDDGSAISMRGLPNLHAALRVRAGYDLRQVIAEYRSIRGVILRLYREQGDISEESRPKLQPISTMNAALDTAIADAVDQYALDEGKAREMFIGMLGHDLRDPLNTIAFGARVLSDRGDEFDAQTLNIAARIGASAKRMESMIRDLLDFARGRLGGGFPIVPVATDARTLIAATVNEIAHAHPERSIVCLAKQAPGSFDVEWDSDRVAQALTNLVSNAVAHGHDPIVVEPKDEGQTIIIEVRNRGEIPQAMLGSIFAPFSQPVNDRRHASETPGPERRRGHLGLGLYIVHEIAKAHDGQVVAESSNGTTIFRTMMPRVVRPNKTATRNAESDHSQEIAHDDVTRAE